MRAEQYAEIFGANILKIRKKRNLTQRQMAEILDVSVRTLRLLEKGITPKRVTCGIIFDICDEFDVNPNDLFQ